MEFRVNRSRLCREEGSYFGFKKSHARASLSRHLRVRGEADQTPRDLVNKTLTFAKPEVARPAFPRETAVAVRRMGRPTCVSKSYPRRGKRSSVSGNSDKESDQLILSAQSPSLPFSALAQTLWRSACPRGPQATPIFLRSLPIWLHGEPITFFFNLPSASEYFQRPLRSSRVEALLPSINW